MNRTPIAAALALVAGCALALIPATAQADTNELQARVDATLAEFPGGVQVSDDTIEWKSGAVSLTLPGGSAGRSIGTCATGSYCAWSLSSYNGTKLSFTSCSAAGTSNSLVSLSSVRSVANARTSGTVQIRSGSTTLYTLAANTGNPSVTGTLSTAVCFT